MKSFKYILVVFVFIFKIAQPQTNGKDRFWFFGDSLSFDFVNGAPEIKKGSYRGVEGSVTATNELGDLLFYGGTGYSNIAEFYNRLHSPLLNSENMEPTSTPRQGPEVVRIPGTDNKYYVIAPTVKSGIANMVISYSIVDMDLDGGLGGVELSNKNKLLNNNSTEGIIVIENEQTPCEYWIISHQSDNTNFNLDEIKEDGSIIKGKQISIGPIVKEHAGYMSYNKNSGKFAIIPGGTYDIALFDFNSKSGDITNYQIVALPKPNLGQEYYSCAFSPSGNFLYVAGGYCPSKLVQVDILNGGLVTEISVDAGDVVRLGPDDIIYVNRCNSIVDKKIGAIKNPEVAGIGCSYDDNYIDIGTSTSYFSLGFPTTLHYCCPFSIGNDTTVCSHSLITLNSNKEIQSYSWSSSDGFINSSSSSVQFNAEKSATYYLSGEVGYCKYTDSISILTAFDTLIVNTSPSTTICSGLSTILTGYSLGGAGKIDYLWSPVGENGQSIVVSPSKTDTYSLQALDQCGNKGMSIVAITVVEKPQADFSYKPDNDVFTNYIIQFTGGYSLDVLDYKWEFGDVNSSISKLPNPLFSYSNSGVYKILLIVNNNFCSDTIVKFVNVKAPPSFENSFLVPNSFTPNGDNLNDLFHVNFGSVLPETFEIKIFNRWGDLVYRSSDIEASWDGKILSTQKPCEAGIYIWVIDYSIVEKSKTREIGAISIIY